VVVWRSLGLSIFGFATPALSGVSIVSSDSNLRAHTLESSSDCQIAPGGCRRHGSGDKSMRIILNPSTVTSPIVPRPSAPGNSEGLHGKSLSTVDGRVGL